MTLFKMNPLAAAVATAMSLSAGNALALTPFEAPQVEVYLSGASAPQSLLGGIATKLFADQNSDGDVTENEDYFVYYDDGDTPATTTDDGKSYRAYYGVVKNDSTITDVNLRGQKLMIINRAKGGSVWGVNPVARAQPIATMKIDSNCTLSSTKYRCPQIGDDLNPLNSNNRVPDFGVSDVEPRMFKDTLNVEFGATQLSEEDLEVFTGTQKATSSLMMGIVATNAVPDTLSISRADYAAMLSGSTTNWSKVGDGSVSGAVAVCRRVQGSGTQASYNWYFNNFPCSTNSLHGTAANTVPARMASSTGYNSTELDPEDPSTGTDDFPIEIDGTAGFTVVENPSSGNVRDCLAKANTGGVHTFTGDDGLKYKVTFAAGTKAIGVLSLDSLGSESGWSFRGLNGAGKLTGIGSFACINSNQLECGIAPVKANHREGLYDFAVELSFQYRNGTSTAPLTGLQKSAADQFIAFIGDPTVLDTLNAGPKEATMALPPTYTPTGTNNVAKATHFGNTCAPLQKLF